MTEDRFHLTGKEILEKDFKTSMRGYNQEEVDEYLDLVIQDYEQYEQMIKDLKEENDRLKKNRSLSKDPVQPEKRETRSMKSGNQVNYDILKRLSNLEKEVFGSREYQDDQE
ncbi:cell division regulator GpsB [Salimicrobium album]|uniref:DivIVA domain-containing protein n=1 Tax=Salimicrobium album TaxID=50717 RepID=A0A1H3E4B2_9BACI|nr:cell division regulator GpsB [Salimicrobium album]SDX72764.1 DivIVA domain-containing protein [Salimicrobium album]